MDAPDMLAAVRVAQDNVAVKQEHYQDGIGDRDAAIRAARDAGHSAIDIAEVTGLTRQQVHKILAA